jgi:prostaglandin-endoperoxide synthase 2
MSMTRPQHSRPQPGFTEKAATFLAGVVGNFPALRTLVSHFAIDKFADATPPRPRPFSMVAPYTTWRSLTDRTYSGRHLAPSTPEWRAALPTEDQVVALFTREEFAASTDTSVLFSMFAQWFTDSFLRTNPFDPRRNSSNHEIDLCQIYGLDETKTGLLRRSSEDPGTRGRLRSQLIDGQEFPEFLFVQERKVGERPTIRDAFVTKPDDQSGDAPEPLHDPVWLLDVILGDLLRAEATGDDTDGSRLSSVFAVGLEHGNSTIGNTIMNVLFLREHNRVAGLLEAAHPDWDDERIFQTTRNVMIVLLLHLVVEEYIRHIAPFELPLETVKFLADGKRWNRSNWISIEFNLLYRWHPLVPDVIGTGDDVIGAKGMRNNNPLVIDAGLESLITRCSNARAGKIGLHNTPWFLTERTDPERPSVEERTVHISRVAELQSFNAYRKQFGRKPLESYEQLTSDPKVQAELKALYGDDIDQLEWYVGIFAEEYPPYLMMGDLMSTMVACDAFTQALTNPLLAPRVYGPDTFSKEGLAVIDSTKTLQEIVLRNTRPGETLECSFRV